MWSKFIEYYKDPYLVTKIQEYFGIDIHYDNDYKSPDKASKKIERNGLDDDQHNLMNGYYTEKNESETKKRHQESLHSSDDDTFATSHSIDREPFTIKNRFWYYIFLFGTELGDEIFYSIFIPLWFWNVDVAVGRRIVLVWAIIMTVGQTMKDVIRWPRPSCPPAVRLQKKWSIEYGMPSTHAMVAVSIPFSVVLFTMNRYVYPFYLGSSAAVIWCAIICVSRVYLGMHTVLDVIAGFTLAVFMMIPLVPLVDAMDHYFLTTNWAVLGLIAVSLATVIYYPCSDKWTPTRGDTTLVVAVTTGIHIGAWINYKTGALLMPQIPPPYNIIWPSYPMIGRTILRSILGFCCILGAKALFKTLIYVTMCAILKVDKRELMQSQNSLENKNKILVDLVYKYVMSFSMGVSVLSVLPNVFIILGIDRPTYYTEL